MALLFSGMLGKGKWGLFWRISWFVPALTGLWMVGYGLMAAFLPAELLSVWISDLLSRPGLQPIFEQRLTPDFMMRLRVAAVLAAVCCCLALWFFRPAKDGAWQHLGLVLRRRLLAEMAFWRQQPSWVKLLLLLLVLFYFCTRTYQMLTVPLERDESMSYYYFIKPGPLVAATYYPYPNNHPLYSITSWPFSLLPLPLVVKIRLPVFLVGLLGIWVFFRLGTRITRHALGGILATLLVFGMFVLARYTVYGRGYAACMVLSALLLWLYHRSWHQSRPLPLGWIVAGQVAGLYIVPTFLYFTAPAMFIYGMFWLANGRISFWRLAGHVALVVGITAVCYTPFVLTNGGLEGFKQAIYSGYAPRPPLPFQEGLHIAALEWNILLLLPRFDQLWYALPPLVLVLSVVFRRRLRIAMPAWLLLCLLTMLPYLIHLLQRQYVPERALGAATIGLSLLVAGLAVQVRFSLRRWVVAALTICSLSLYAQAVLLGKDLHAADREKDETGMQLARQLLSHSIDTLYLADIWYRPVIEAHFHEANRPLTILTNQPESPGYQRFEGIGAYDASLLTIGTAAESGVSKQPIFTKNGAVLYLR